MNNLMIFKLEILRDNDVLFFFYIMCPSGTWMIMTLHIIQSFILSNYVTFVTLPRLLFLVQLSMDLTRKVGNWEFSLAFLMSFEGHGPCDCDSIDSL